MSRCVRCDKKISRYNKDVLCFNCRDEMRKQEFSFIQAFNELHLDPNRMSEEDFRTEIQDFLLDWLPYLREECQFVPYRRYDIAESLPVSSRHTQVALEDLVQRGMIEDVVENGKRVGIRTFRLSEAA